MKLTGEMSKKLDIAEFLEYFAKDSRESSREGTI